MAKTKRITLSGNELALCENGLAHAINFLKRSPSRTAYVREQMKRYLALLEKLDHFTAYAYPSIGDEVELPVDYGDEIIMRSDPTGVKKARARVG